MTARQHASSTGAPIREPASLFRVEKIEGDEVEAERGERARVVDHERAALAGAGAVREDERRAGAAGPVAG